MPSSIIKCSCVHAYQDSLYGRGNRVANGTPNGQMRCTVCSILHGGASVVKVAKVAKITEEAPKPVVHKSVEKKVEEKPKVAEKKSTDKKSTEKKKSLKGGKR